MPAPKPSTSELAVGDLDFIDREFDRAINSRIGGLLVEDLAAEILRRESGPDAISARVVINPTTGQQLILSTDEHGELAAIEAAHGRTLTTTGHLVRRPDGDGFKRMKARLGTGGGK